MSDSFKDIMENLDQAVETLESGDLELEDALEVFKKGVELVKQGNNRLNKMESKVELLLKEMDAGQVEEFDPQIEGGE